MANLSQIKREQMLEFLETLKKQHNDDESLKAINQIEKELTSKKYGLIWEEHEENVDVKLQTHIPVFSEVKEKELINKMDNEDCNFLLEGDNLHSLKMLEKTHKGKIDVVYIDPPYNTGVKDFIYDDKYIDSLDGYRHSKWLSFMQGRLFLAKELLSFNGTIFISIDDNEQAQLKMLCDEIFGEANFLGDIIWKHTQQSKNDERQFARMYNHTLVYAKSIDKLQDFYFARTEEDNKNYSNPDNDKKGDWRSGDVRSPSPRPTLCYDIIAPNGNIIHAPENGWRWSEETLKKKMEDGEIIYKKDYSGIIRKIYLCDQEGRTPENLWEGAQFGTTRMATALLKDIFNGKTPFDTPKPIELVKKVLEVMGKDNVIVLDFFAGSGTTGQAVLELNQEDGGNRKFILCTNNENNICEDVTYQRLKTVITGQRKDGSKYSEGIPANLKYYKTDFVAKDSEDIFDELLEHVEELIQLKYGTKIDNKKYVIIMDDDEMDEFEKQFADYNDLQAVFINQDVLLSTSQEKMLQNVETYIVPDCFYDTELREVGELW